MVSIMTSQPVHMTDPLRSRVDDSNIWREEYYHKWLDSCFPVRSETSKHGSFPARMRSTGINGFRSEAPPTCRPVFAACHLGPHGHNDVQETNTKHEDFTKSWIQHFEEDALPSLTNVNVICKPSSPPIVDVNNNSKPSKVQKVPIDLKATETAKKESKQNDSDKAANSKEITAKDIKKAAKVGWMSVSERKEGLAPIWSVQSSPVKLMGTVTESSAGKEDYSHRWDDAELIATQCGLSEVNSDRREEAEREWRHDLLYYYPQEAEGASYHDVIYVELNNKADKMNRPELRRKLSFGC